MLTQNDVVELTTTSAWNTTGTLAPRRPSLPHPTLYWGYQGELLFSGSPDFSLGMYALALIFVFSFSVLVKWLSSCTNAAVKPGADKLATCAFGAGMYVVKSGFSYLVVLSVVSFNGGIFLAAIFGHALGFLIFLGPAFGNSAGVGG